MMKRKLPLLIVCLLVLGACTQQQPQPATEEPAAKDSSSAQHDAMAARLEAGQKVYESNCAGCHDSGVAGALKLGDKAGWADRMSQGTSLMTKKSIEGFEGKIGSMPPKGGNDALTDEEVANAVEYMVDKVR